MNSKKHFPGMNTVWLLAGSVSLLFMGGKWNIPLITWIGSIFFLRYFRISSGFLSIFLAFPFIGLSSHVFFIGLAEQVEPWFRVLIDLCFTFYIIVPCIADRFLYQRIPNRFMATLIYPAALIVVQFLFSYIGQLGTILHWTGSLFSQKPLIQLTSITGVWGPSFLVGWVASVVNLLWEEKSDFKKVKLPVLAVLGVLFTVIIWGNIRMLFFPPSAETVKVGAVVVGFRVDNLFYIYDDLPDKEKKEQKEKYRALSLEVQDELFSTSEKLMPTGIKILSWASGNAAVFAEDEPRLIRRLQEFAQKNKVYFFPSLLVLGEHNHPDENHVLAIKPDGQIAYDHYKGRSPNKGYYQGNVIETLNTPFGRIASPICFEMEFHRFIRQAGKKGVDIFIVPGDEPARGASNMHTELSMLRAVENGFSMIRTTLEGLTMSADYQGRVLAQMNFYQTLSDRYIITEIPVKGVRTFYSKYGDWFAWLCIITLLYFTVKAIIPKKQDKQ